MGVAGSGKTTLAKEILRRVNAVYLDNNHIADAFFPNTRSGRRYERFRPNFYKALYAITEENLQVGNSVLLDVPHIKEIQTVQWRRFVKALTARTRSKLIIIRCHCSEQALHSRIRLRNERRDWAKLKNWQQFLTEQPLASAIPFSHLDVNTETDLALNAAAAVEYIVQQSRRSPTSTSPSTHG
jgi:predicted kinase